MKNHPNKEIEAAIQAAIDAGWKRIEAGGSAHCFCRLYCGPGHKEHMMSVWSTPKSPTNHARQIYRQIKKCQP